MVSLRRWLSSSMARLTRRRSHQRTAGSNRRSIRATAASAPARTASQSGIVTDVATCVSPETNLLVGSKPDGHKAQRTLPAGIALNSAAHWSRVDRFTQKLAVQAAEAILQRCANF